MKTLTILLLLGFTALANAQQGLQLVEGGYELTLADITFPNSTAGTMIVQECDECDRRSLQVSSGTIYSLPSGNVALSDFLEVVAELRLTEQGHATYVSVFYDLQTRRVTRVSMHPDAS